MHGGIDHNVAVNDERIAYRLASLCADTVCVVTYLDQPMFNMTLIAGAPGSVSG